MTPHEKAELLIKTTTFDNCFDKSSTDLYTAFYLSIVHVSTLQCSEALI